MLASLYFDPMPERETWIGYAVLWLAGEWLLTRWPRQAWTISARWLRAIHVVRSAGPWLMIWPVASYWLGWWLLGTRAEVELRDWGTSASWSRFIPSWLMMGALGWLMQRVRQDGWPVRPLAAWYRRYLIPLGCAWSVLLVAQWNLSQDGAMAPLPYIPLLNPLDLSTCFAILLLLALHRMPPPAPATASQSGWPVGWIAPFPLAMALFGYAWFNLVLLRTVSHYHDVPYVAGSLFASQFIQAMLSLVWSVTALLLMRYAARHASRGIWMGGAVLLAVVVGKLFLVDLSNIGGVERIVSFLGVGALMVGIGYLAPFPQTTISDRPAETA